MTLLPEALLHNSITKIEEQVYFHNWLYSVVPAQLNSSHQGLLQIFLAGFCKNCTNVFSVEIPIGTNGDYRQTHVNVIKTGCVGP